MVYFDNCATTKMSDEALDEYVKLNDLTYGNTSSLNAFGAKAEEKLIDSKKIVASSINCLHDEVYFTSSATESNNIVIQGIFNARKKRKNHFITQKTEHPSVLETYKYLEKQGALVTYLDVDSNGHISLSELKESLTKDTALVSIMHINNETGVIFPIEEIGKIIKDSDLDILFHVDAVQSFGKYKVSVKESYIDFLTFSGHKMHGAKGVGGLYAKKGINLPPLFYGGKHESGIRPSTVNITGIGATAKAIESSYNDLEKNREYVKSLKTRIIDNLKDIDQIHINGTNTSDYILSLSIDSVRGEVLLNGLQILENPIYISVGTACSGKTKNAMLSNYGFDKDYVISTIRLGLSRYNTIDEVDYLCREIKTLVSFLRKHKKK